MLTPISEQGGKQPLATRASSATLNGRNTRHEASAGIRHVSKCVRRLLPYPAAEGEKKPPPSENSMTHPAKCLR